MINPKHLTLVSGLAIALAACGDEPEAPVTEETPVETASEYDPMTRDYTLSEDAQTRRAEFDTDGFRTEYTGYRDEISAETDSEESMGAEREADMEEGQMPEAGAPAPMPSRDANTNMRARADMSWSYLDRNDDNQLSVAEYAIWAIPLDPNATAPNDSGTPQLTDDQINKAADSFFYYDIDGDTYLDRREFTAARRGEDVGA